MFPVEGQIIAPFAGRRNRSRWGECDGAHTGVDIGVAETQDVKAARDGQVKWVNFGRGYGSSQLAVMCHDGSMDFYGYVTDRAAEHDAQVMAGDVIGRIEGGGYLHFQTSQVQGQADWCENAVDPQPALEDGVEMTPEPKEEEVLVFPADPEVDEVLSFPVDPEDE